MPTDETVTNVIARNLRAEIARMELTQAKFGDLLDMRQQALSRRLMGETPWTINELIGAARALEVPLSALVPDSLRDATP
jgi:transcriptional regulator with XRE-family HTH domain